MVFHVPFAAALLALAPFFAAVALLWRKSRGALHRGMLKNEVLALMGTFIPLALAAGSAQDVAGLGPWTAVASIVPVFIFAASAYALVRWRHRFGYRSLPRSHRLARLVLLTALALLAALALMVGAEGLAAALSGPAYLWLVVKERASLPGRAFNVLLVLGGGIAYFLLLFNVGSDSRALHSLRSVNLAVAAIGVRLLMVFTTKRDPERRV